MIHFLQVFLVISIGHLPLPLLVGENWDCNCPHNVRSGVCVTRDSVIACSLPPQSIFTISPDTMLSFTRSLKLISSIFFSGSKNWYEILPEKNIYLSTYIHDIHLVIIAFSNYIHFLVVWKSPNPLENVSPQKPFVSILSQFL